MSYKYDEISTNGFKVTTMIDEGENIIECFFYASINKVTMISRHQDTCVKANKVAIFKPKGHASIQVQSED